MPFEIKKSEDKVIILGSGAGWENAPQKSASIIYALNDYVYAERYQIKPDILFIMDVLDEKPLIVSGISNLGDVIERINKMKIPLISPFRYEEIPLSEAFPLKECVKECGIPYFTNTICYMIAYAILKKTKEIDIYGVNQASSSEYFYEKAGVEYWLGMAVGKGIEIRINGIKSELLSNKARFGGNLLYGYSQTYDQIIRAEEKFGEPIVKKLSMPSPNVSRLIKDIR